MPVQYEDLKTVAEQTAHEFGQRCSQIAHGKGLGDIARRYALTHQCSAFPRTDNGYGRLLAAFCAGAGINLNEI